MIERIEKNDVSNTEEIASDKIHISISRTCFALIKFLEDYNENLQDGAINGLISELCRPDVCPHVYKSWVMHLLRQMEMDEKNEFESE